MCGRVDASGIGTADDDERGPIIVEAEQERTEDDDEVEGQEKEENEAQEERVAGYAPLKCDAQCMVAVRRAKLADAFGIDRRVRQRVVVESLSIPTASIGWQRTPVR